MRHQIILKIFAIYCFFYIRITSSQANIERGKFTKIGKKYYLIENKNMLNWFGASHFCRSINSNLASIETAEEMQAINEYFKANGLIKSGWLKGEDVYWIGGNDLSNISSWSWIGTGKPLTFTRWANGQPDKDKQPAGAERCISIWPYDVITWNDLQCLDRTPYICERNTLFKLNFTSFKDNE